MFKPREKGSSLNFLKLESGQKVVGVFRGEPRQFRQHFHQGPPMRSSECMGKDCEDCKAGSKTSFRFRVNFITKDLDGSLVSKIFEQGGTTWDNLVALSSEYDLPNHFVTISRFGAGKETTYSILPTAKGELSAEQRAKIAAVPLQSLESVEAAADHQESPTESGFNSNDIPF